MLRPLLKRTRRAMTERLDLVLRLYPPYLGAGIRVRHIAPDYRHIRVEMPLKLTNQNYVGTHFGGSLYAMVDPFFMLMLLKNLGPEVVVWDKSATIAFKRPGRSTVHAEFRLTQEDIDKVWLALENQRVYEPVFEVEIRDQKGELVARVEKTLYIRRKES
ncbi:DUF4442 domain-containing protein [Lujinxingia sediminis]|uniref:DUF4442 domain-containing protein n=1 Tax=Lujinxingia sediminis TaxID=2480984 RepID=A0ABY0CQ37_9DELT|nr:DUF4442 domain-containing protein [Lujinxingia sediminis]RVU42464.1 DUF4442 domain-containing protein [Lujinxingia sediminis]